MEVHGATAPLLRLGRPVRASELGRIDFVMRSRRLVCRKLEEEVVQRNWVDLQASACRSEGLDLGDRLQRRELDGALEFVLEMTDVPVQLGQGLSQTWR